MAGDRAWPGQRQPSQTQQSQRQSGQHQPDPRQSDPRQSEYFARDADRHISQLFDPSQDDVASLPPSSAGQGMNPRQFSIPGRASYQDVTRMSITPRTPLTHGPPQNSWYRPQRVETVGDIGAGPRLEPGLTRRSTSGRAYAPYQASTRSYASARDNPARVPSRILSRDQQPLRNDFYQPPLRESVATAFRPVFGPSLQPAGDQFHPAPPPQPSARYTSTHSQAPSFSARDVPIPGSEYSHRAHTMEVLRPGSGGRSFYKEYEDWARPEKLLSMYRELIDGLRTTSFPEYAKAASYPAPGPWVDTDVDRHGIQRSVRNSNLLYAAFEHFYSLVDKLSTSPPPLASANAAPTSEQVLQMLSDVDCPYISSMAHGGLQYFDKPTIWFICVGCLHWMMMLARDAVADAASLEEDDEADPKSAAAKWGDQLEDYLEPNYISMFALKISAPEDVLQRGEAEIRKTVSELLTSRKSDVRGRREVLKQREVTLAQLKQRLNKAAEDAAARTRIANEIDSLQGKVAELKSTNEKEEDKLGSVETEMSTYLEERDIMARQFQAHDMTVSRVLQESRKLDELKSELDKLTEHYEINSRKIKSEAMPPVEAGLERLQLKIHELNSNVDDDRLRVELVDPMGRNFGAPTEALLGGRSLRELQAAWRQSIANVDQQSRDNAQHKVNLQKELETIDGRLISIRAEITVLRENVSAQDIILANKQNYISNVAKDMSETTSRREHANDEKVRVLQSEHDELQKSVIDIKNELQNLDQQIKNAHPRKMAAASQIKLLGLVQDSIGTRLFNLTETVNTHLTAVGSGRERLSNLWPVPPREVKQMPTSDELRLEYRRRVAEIAERNCVTSSTT